MNYICTDILNIILEYKYNLELHDKVKKINNDINNIIIEYHLSYLYIYSDYIIKIIKKNNVIINTCIFCICCGRLILNTKDEYYDVDNNIITDYDINNYLIRIKQEMIMDYYNNFTFKFNEYSKKKYNNISYLLSNDFVDNINLDIL